MLGQVPAAFPGTRDEMQVEMMQDASVEEKATTSGSRYNERVTVGTTRSSSARDTALRSTTRIRMRSSAHSNFVSRTGPRSTLRSYSVKRYKHDSDAQRSVGSEATAAMFRENYAKKFMSSAEIDKGRVWRLRSALAEKIAQLDSDVYSRAWSSPSELTTENMEVTR